MTDLVSRVRRGLTSDWGIYLPRICVVSANLVSLLLIALMMLPEDFGQFVFMFSAALSLSAIASVGAPALLLRELSAAIETGVMGISRGQVLRLVLVWPSAILAAVAIASVALQIQLAHFRISFHPPLGHTVLVLAAAGLINLVNVFAAICRVQGYTGTAMAFRDAGPQLVMLGGTAAAVLFLEPNPVTVFTFGVVFMCFALVAGIMVFLGTGSGKIARPTKKGTPVSVSGFWGTTVANMAWTQADILIGGLFLSANSLGEYQIVKRIANFANMPQIVANWAVVVGIGIAFAEGQVEKIQKFARRALYLSVLPLMLINFFLLGSAPFILGWFSISMTANIWILLILLLIGSSVNVLFGANFILASQCKLEKSAFIARLVGIASCIGFIVALSPTEPRFIAIAYVAGVIVSNGCLWHRIRASLAVDTSIFALIKRN